MTDNFVDFDGTSSPHSQSELLSNPQHGLKFATE